MTRLAREEQLVFERTMRQCYEEYAENFKINGQPSRHYVEELIKRYKVRRASEAIDYKGFMRYLQRNNLPKYNEWLNEQVRAEFSILEQNIDKESVTKRLASLSTKLHCSIHTIRNKVNRLGLNPTYMTHNDRMKRRALALQLHNEGMSFLEITEKLNCTEVTIRKYLREEGVTLDVFSQHNKNTKVQLRDLLSLNLQNAHLWGLIWSDGSISSRSAVVIGLSVEDLSYLRQIKESICTSGEAYKMQTISSEQNRGSFDNAKAAVQISISRVHVVRTFANWGLPYNKETQALKLPKNIETANDAIFFEFLRGFFEGDGCITSNKNAPNLSL